jgi:lipoprotein NlpI
MTHESEMPPHRLRRLRAWTIAASALCGLAIAGAQTAGPPSASRAVAAKGAAPGTVAVTAPAAFANGYRIAAAPSWVRPVDVPVPAAAPGAQGPGYRTLLSDTQTRLDDDGGPQMYSRTVLVATDSAALQEVSKAELAFNPAFQTLSLHQAAVWRNGVRHDRLPDARVELLRREERLEQGTLTGQQTLFVALNDVRVGDRVDIAYTIHGANPIFKGRFADNFPVAFGSAADLVQVRIDYPPGRSLRVKGIRADVTPEFTLESGRQVLRIVRRGVGPVRAEEQVPPWFKVWPSVHISEYADWTEVARWADELFADAGEPGAELAARIDAWRARGLPAEQLIAAVVETVQDEVRYFSASLGESSHRPKPPSRTFDERLGDCKDKVALLNAALRRLGFDARPALVSIQRNRGIADYLPGHDQFDHVITRLEFAGKVYWIDPTLQQQGRGLDTRGHADYGAALVVAPATTALTRIELPALAHEGVEFDQTWDVSDLRRAAQFTSIVRARGLAAEGWRGAVAAAGVQRLAENVAGSWVRLLPGLVAVGEPLVRDDRDANLFEFELRHELPGFGTYERGTLTVEAPALEILDSLAGPREARREMPWLNDQPRQVRQRIRVVAPRNFQARPPAPQDIGDKHFGLSARMETRANVFTLTLTYTRKLDEVLPADLAAYRERVQAARRVGGTTLRLPLLDADALQSAFADIEQRMDRALGPTADSLREILVRQELERALATETLKLAGEASPLAGTLLYKRAVANNALNHFDATLADVDKALPLAPQPSDLHYARGLALLSLGRADEAAAALRNVKEPVSRAFVAKGLGNALYYQGRYADAEASFRDAAQDSVGEERDFALIWLYLSAERNGGKGRAALAPYVEQVDAQRWPGAVIHFLAGRKSQDELLREARKDKQMERLNLSEAWFYVGQQMLLGGDPEGARRMFQRTVEIGALPYREHAFAQLELKRAAAR